MPKHNVNEVRGEVELILNGEQFVLCAEMARVAAFCREIGVQNLAVLNQRLQDQDPIAIEAGVRSLCITDNVDQLRDHFFFGDFGKANVAICKALGHGLDQGKDDAAEAETERTETP